MYCDLASVGDGSGGCPTVGTAGVSRVRVLESAFFFFVLFFFAKGCREADELWLWTNWTNGRLDINTHAVVCALSTTNNIVHTHTLIYALICIAIWEYVCKFGDKS